ncbi:MAG TPA: lytic transglycosylase domain-containing protein [Oligoflexia bacterium]|nr:lytic transglycosylase domain-containing protein [Oligoflexia bacterium]HMP27835.1 lytic transglycosylase domain-containing protein [Oligoflexia bacterium]
MRKPLTPINTLQKKAPLIKTGLILLAIISSCCFSGCASTFNRRSEKELFFARSIDKNQQLNEEKLLEALLSYGPPAKPLPPIMLIDNHEVRREISFLMQNKSQTIKQGIQRATPFIGMINLILLHFGLPYELIHIPLIESNYDHKAESSAGAVGLWQIMKPLAKESGMRVDWLKDERFDPLLSTFVAAKHFNWLYKRFNDWWLAIAAYNAGQARIKNAIEKGGSMDFFKLARMGLIPEESIRFVSKFIALSIIFKHPAVYGF